MQMNCNKTKERVIILRKFNSHKNKQLRKGKKNSQKNGTYSNGLRSLAIGDKVVVPFAGIARVDEVVRKKFDHSEGDFYVLTPELSPGSKLFVAKNEFGLQKLRAPLIREDAGEVFDILKKRGNYITFSAEGQHAYYEKLIKLIKYEGPPGLAKIVRHFYDRYQQSLLNTKHIRKLVKFAFTELIAEVAVAYGVSSEKAEGLIDRAIRSRKPKNWKPIGQRLEQMIITDTTE